MYIFHRYTVKHKYGILMSKGAHCKQRLLQTTEQTDIANGPGCTTHKL